MPQVSMPRALEQFTDEKSQDAHAAFILQQQAEHFKQNPAADQSKSYLQPDSHPAAGLTCRSRSRFGAAAKHCLAYRRGFARRTLERRGIAGPASPRTKANLRSEEHTPE